MHKFVIDAIKNHPIASKESLGDKPIEFEHNGLKCHLLRGPTGAWNGYVALPEGHPWRKYDSEWEIPANVHGGLTYCLNGVIGFDCAHFGDARLNPSPFEPDTSGDVYRTEEYAREQTKFLADQVKASKETK